MLFGSYEDEDDQINTSRGEEILLHDIPDKVITFTIVVAGGAADASTSSSDSIPPPRYEEMSSTKVFMYNPGAVIDDTIFSPGDREERVLKADEADLFKVLETLEPQPDCISWELLWKSLIAQSPPSSLSFTYSSFKGVEVYEIVQL